MKATAGGTPREPQTSRRGRRVLASALALMLGLTLSPTTMAWAAPDDSVPESTAPEGAETTAPETAAQPGETQTDESTADEASVGDGCTAEGGVPGKIVEGGGCEAETQGAQPNADSEAVPGLALSVKVFSDGTPGTIDGGTGWDPNSNPGNDAGPKNGIVRVNDTVTYDVEYVVSSTEAEDLTWSITFPKGMQVMALPGFCMESGTPRPGSSLTPLDPSANVTLPLTANSRDQLEQQTLTCNMGAKAVAADTVKVTAKVLNLVHQGQDLTIPAANVTAKGIIVPEPASSPLPTVKASARLMWDISKNSTALQENTGYTYGPTLEPCDWAPTESCMRTTYPLLLSAPAGGKGAMPAIGDITLVDDLSPRKMYPGLTEAQYLEIEAELDKYGSRATATAVAYQQPFSRIAPSQWATSTAVNSVRDSGVLTVQQPGGPGTAANLTIKNPDMSLRTYPTQAGQPDGTSLPGNEAYAVALSVRVLTPVATIKKYGTKAANSDSWTLPTINHYSELHLEGFDPANGDVQGSNDQPGAKATGGNLSQTFPKPQDLADWHWNDYRATTPNVQNTGSFGKAFAGLPGAPGNMTPANFVPANAAFAEGPPGGATRGSGGITVAETQVVTSQLVFVGSNPAVPDTVSFVGCDAWDNDKLHLIATEANSPYTGDSSGTAWMQRIPSRGEAVWLSGYNNLPDNKFATDASQGPTMKVQYSASKGVDGEAVTCNEPLDDPSWVDSPEELGASVDLPNNGGTYYPSVARVRVFLVLPEPVAVTAQLSAMQVRASVSIGLRVADFTPDLPTGTILPNYAGVKMVSGENLTPAQMLTHSQAWARASYTKDDHVGHPAGDRLILVAAQARIDKEVRPGTDGAWSKTPPQSTGGDTVQYRLSPSLTSGAQTPGILKDVWVEDCMPGVQTFSEASVAPAVVSPGSTPADAKRTACAAGQTYIRWILPQQEVNQPIEPIIYSVDVSPTADDGQYTNTVVVWAQDDATPEAQRKAQAGIQIANIAGVKLEKVALTPVVQVNRPGQTVDNELNKWAIRLTNTMPASEQSAITHPDMIDVLPKQGEQGTAHNGTFKFVSAAVTQGGADTRILYTKAANVSANPADPSNGASGATTWCDAPTGGTRVSGLNGCPASAAEVTALRVIRPVAYQSGDVIEVELAMVGVDNRAADRYVNRVMAQAEGLTYQVGPLNRPEVAVESKLGDYVWWDLNRDGVQNAFKGADEPVARGVTVKLSGTDDLGNPVSLETTTDDDGKYVFEQLRASNGDGYTVTFVKPAGSEFTAPLAGGDTSLDSNAAVDTGASAPTVLGANARDYTIDAGLLPLGGVQIHKSIKGVGAGEFAAEDELEFEVVCTFDDELGDEPNPVEVLNETVTLPVNGAAQVLSEVLGGLPAYSSCTITETGAGSADEAAGPVTVAIKWDGVAQRAVDATAMMDNFYSMGSVQVAKKLEGDRDAVNKAKDLVFEVLVTCQVEVPDPENEGETKRADVYSGVVKIKGGQTKYLVDENDEPRGLPVGARCFGSEVNTGGAAKAVVDLNTWEKSAEVVKGKPDELQQLTITATNTFKNPPCTGPCLPNTGGQITGALLIGAGLLLAGALILLKRRRRAENPDHPPVIG